MSVDRIGNLLAGLNRPESEPFRENTECGGALLYVTRKQAIGMAAAGRVRWVQDPERIPEEGRHSWRVWCQGEILQVARTAELPPDATPEQRASAPKYVVNYGLCGNCCAAERGVRAHLRKEAAKAADEAKNGRRGRKFAEEADG